MGVLKRGIILIDEKKVGLMTRLAVYEKHEKRRNLVMSRYYQTDYVRYNVLKTWVASTVAYWLIVGAYAFMKFDELLAEINDIDYFSLMYKILGGYVVFCLVYFLFSSMVYHYRYIKAKSGLVEYNSNLKDLIELEGGPMHHGKLIKNSEIGVTSDKKPDEKEAADSEKKEPRTVVNRSRIVEQRIQEEEKRKGEEIIENVRRRNERNEEMLRIKKQQEADRRRIQERRKQIEQEQMEELRRMHMQQMNRENHVYNNTGSNEGRDK